MPYFPYSRQSKKKTHRGAITARMLANLMKVAGVDHVITIDLHANQMQGFFKCPVDNLRAEPLIAKWIRQNIQDWQESVVVSKNPGGTKRVTSLADALNVSFGIVTTDSRRTHTNVGSMLNSTIFEAMGTDGTNDHEQLEEEVMVAEAFTPARSTRQDFALHTTNGEAQPGRTSRQRAVTNLSMTTRNRLMNGSEAPSSPLANSQRAESIDSGRQESPHSGPRRANTAPGISHDDDGYEEPEGDDDEDQVRHDSKSSKSQANGLSECTRCRHRPSYPRPYRGRRRAISRNVYSFQFG
jgi:ribose-phosphate pyrophosphokinase